MKVLGVFLCLVLVASGYQGLRVQNYEFNGKCPDSASVFDVSKLSVDPAPQKGEKVTFCLEGTMLATLNLDNLTAFVKYGGADVYNQSFDESESFRAGDHATVCADVLLYSFAPSGAYSVDLKLYDTSNTELSCWRYDFTL